MSYGNEFGGKITFKSNQIKSMSINQLNLNTEHLNNSPKINKAALQLQALIEILNQREISNSILLKINAEIAEINTSDKVGNSLLRLIKNKQSIITKLLEKELKLVPINYYRNLWLVLGMSAFGLPIGVAFGLSIGNIALLGIGLPIGLGIGASLGSIMDKKAKNEGRQLNIELKY